MSNHGKMTYAHTVALSGTSIASGSWLEHTLRAKIWCDANVPIDTWGYDHWGNFSFMHLEHAVQFKLIWL